MYHRGHSNQTIGYNNQHNNIKRINAHKHHYNNLTLSPNAYTHNTISISPRSSSPTLSYELPYQLQSPLSNNISTRKNKSKTPKPMQFMSKITEESKPTPHTSPVTSPIANKHKHNKSKRKNHCHKHNNNNNNKSIDNIKSTEITNSTSNRSYRKYKTRQTKQKTHKKSKSKIKKPKHYNSESHELLQNNSKHRNTKKKSDKKRKKHRAQSTVLTCDNNNNSNNNIRPETAKYNNNNNHIEHSYMNYDKYESKQSSQDSYIANKKHMRPQTAKINVKRKSKHNKIRSNGTIITKSKHRNKSNKNNKNNHIKSHSYGKGNNKIYSKQSKMNLNSIKKNRLNFNEYAMDYMSAEQQLLYLYDYTSANVINRSSASHTTHTTHTTTSTNTTPKTNQTYEDRDIFGSSISNIVNGNNSDAITPSHNELHVCSSPVAISYPIETTNTNTIKTISQTPNKSLQFLTSPPLSAITGVYSQLSNRAVTYSPAAHTHTHTHTHTQSHNDRDDSHSYGNYLNVNNINNRRYFIEKETQLPRLPSPHYLFKLDSNSENDFAITPFNKNDIEFTHISNTNPTIIIRNENSIQSQNGNNDVIIIDHNQLLEIPASLTAEESGACYLEGESNINMIENINISDISTMENTVTTVTEHNELNLEGMDCDDTDIITEQSNISYPNYRLYINDQEWNDQNIKTPRQIPRNSKLQCIV